ncbi:unnamed protein product, partial [Effrenium voratum]
DSHPGKGHDKEVSEVRWMNAGEVKHHMNHGRWRFQNDQAYLYLRWLHNRAYSENEIEGNETSLNETEVESFEGNGTTAQLKSAPVNMTNTTGHERRLLLI